MRKTGHTSKWGIEKSIIAHDDSSIVRTAWMGIIHYTMASILVTIDRIWFAFSHLRISVSTQQVHCIGGSRGRPWRPPPIRPKNFSVSCRFLLKICNIVCWCALEGRFPLLQRILDPSLHCYNFKNTDRRNLLRSPCLSTLSLMDFDPVISLLCPVHKMW